MGTKSSKNERISSAARKRYSQDDLQSRATQLTEDSSLAPAPYSAANNGVSSSLKSRLSSRYLTESAPTSSKWPAKLPAKKESLEVLDPSKQYLQDSQPRPPAMDGGGSSRTTPPVKLPQNNQGSTLQQESDEARYLAKMYDTRTWEMYRRITEARKNTSYQSTAPSFTKSESTSEWENLQQEEDASSPGGGEMFFLFDFE